MNVDIKSLIIGMLIIITLLATIGVFLIAGIIIESIEKYFAIKERFNNEG